VSNSGGIFPNEVAIYRLVGALLLEQNDEWALQRRYMTLETLEVRPRHFKLSRSKDQKW